MQKFSGPKRKSNQKTKKPLKKRWGKGFKPCEKIPGSRACQKMQRKKNIICKRCRHSILTNI